MNDPFLPWLERMRTEALPWRQRSRKQPRPTAATGTEAADPVRRPSFLHRRLERMGTEPLAIAQISVQRKYGERATALRARRSLIGARV